MTYREAGEKAGHLSSALRKEGLAQGARVGCFGPNSPEWMLAMQACNNQSMQCIPLYDTLGAEVIEYIVNHAEISLVFCEATKMEHLVEAMPKCPSLKTVVMWGEIKEDSLANTKASGVKTYSFDEFVEAGKADPVEDVPPSPESVCTIMYTSGTTGNPKGVVLTHSAIVSAVVACYLACCNWGIELTSNDVFLSFLPLAHIFDRVTEEMFLSFGGQIGYWRGDVKMLVDDIGSLRPTFFCGVPRIYDRIFAGVTDQVNKAGGLKKFLFNFGFSRKMHHLTTGVKQSKASPLFDRIVFSKVKQRLGGRVRIIVSGAAPLARHVEDFLRVTMCCPVVQGYGLTETCASSFICEPDNINMAGTVGTPFPCIEFMLESVPEMDYDALGDVPRGEICMRGPALFSGYYKQEEATSEVMDSNGWFHTGDVGELADGCLKVIDRKKNIFKLSQGEYVAAEKLENVYGQCGMLDMIWVYGDSYKSMLVAVAVPNEGKLVSWASEKGIKGSFTELCTSEAAKAHILSQLSSIGKENKLKGFEMVKAIHLSPEPFSVENDLLTPTFKKRRPQLKKAFQSELDALYASLG